LDSRDGVPFNDHLFGGRGNDTALMDPFDFFDGGPDQDGIDFFGTGGNDHIRVSRQVGSDGPQAVIAMNNKLQVFNYRNGETINVFAGAGNDEVIMDPSAGQFWKARFFGENGNDRLIGGAMDDLLDGGPGNDVLDGGAGDNVLIGGGGHDVLRNGHPPLAPQALAAASIAAPVFTDPSNNSTSAGSVHFQTQLKNRSAQPDLRQEPAKKNAPHSRATIVESKTFAKVLDDELLEMLMSGLLSKRR
jgi:Ca2+-binding RTX toxin-like protein